MLNLSLIEWLASLIAGGSIVVGTAIGLVLLLRSKGLHTANVALGLLLLVAAAAVLHELIVNVRPMETGWTVVFLPLLYTYSIGPLLYAYIHSKLNVSPRISRWHFVLPVAQAVLTISVALAPASMKMHYMNAVYAPWYSMLEDVVFTASFVTYLFLSHHAIARSQKHIRFKWEHPRYRWLRRLVVGSAVILAVSVLFNITSPVLYAATGTSLYEYEWAAFAENVAYSALLYWIAVGGFVQTMPGLQRVVGAAANTPPRKERYNVNPPLLAEHTAAIEQLMAEECPYLDADLTLATLGEQLGITDKVLSFVLNEGLGVSYVEYVNGLRVEEAKRQLADPSTANLTVLGVGLNAGFSSKATFNRVFKQVTGTTPSEYRKSARLSSS